MGPILQKQYISEKETVIEALDDIQSFIDKMTIFQTAYPNYEYSIQIRKPRNNRTNIKWIVELNVLKNEHPQNIERAKRLT